MIAPLKIAVVGHSNAGKTSIVAALTRDASLEMAEEAGTTLRAYTEVFEIAGEAVLSFVDTPGFERAGAINSHLDEAAGSTAVAPDGRTLVEDFVAEEDDGRFRSEKEALGGALAADVLAYVADAGEEPTGQKRQEVRLLRRLGVPVIAVINGVRGSWLQDWEEMLGREGVDMRVQLDAWDFPPSAEERFYKLIGMVRPEHEGRLDRIIELRDQRAAQRRGRSARLIAEMMIDALAWRVEMDCGSRREGERQRPVAEASFRETLVAREAALFDELLGTYGFDGLAVEGGDIGAVEWNRGWQESLFSAEVVKRYGASVTTLTLAGAANGGQFDHFGAHGQGAATGAIQGLAGGHWLGQLVTASIDRDGRLKVGPLEPVQAPIVLVNRAVDCWQEVQGRSHARQDVPELAGDADSEQRLGPRGIARLGRLALRVRKHADWSGLADEPRSRDPERAAAVDDLAALVEDLLIAPGESQKS